MISDIRNRQTEAAECGLACVAMAAALAGSNIDLNWLRQRYPVSARGSSLKDIITISNSVGMSGRAVRCELDEIGDLKIPSILHWGLKHFVVFSGRKGKKYKLFDPAKGYIFLSIQEISRKFTGVALELSPSPGFQKRVERSPLGLGGIIRLSPEVKRGLLHALVLSIVAQIYVSVSPFYLQMAIDNAAMKGDEDLLRTLALGFAGFAVINAGAEAFRAVIFQKVAALLNWDMTVRLFHHMVRLPLPWFQRRRLADTNSRFQSIDPIRNLISNGVVGAVIDGALSIVTVVMMFVFSPALSIVTLAGLAVYVLIRLAWLPLSRKYAANALQATIVEQGKRLETLRAIQTIKAMGGEAEREGNWANKFADTIRTGQENALIANGFQICQRTIDVLITIIVIYLGVLAIIKNTMSIGILYAFISYRAQFNARVTNLVDQVISARMLSLYTFRLADIVLTPAEDDAERSRPDLGDIQGLVEAENIYFQYGPTDRLVLRNVNLRVEPGEFVAIVGPSGAGKSTLMKVLSGLYPPTAGEVRLDGLPLATWGVKLMRRNFGIVMQDDELLPGSIAENVSFFDEKLDMDKVWRCLSMVCIDKEVNRMPMKAETFVGDMGSTLSGGQKQRILLARALYKDPKILLLDEATSHLDVETERNINKTLSSLNITRIVIAHRKETIQVADRLIRLERC
ncbi:peptidase domain-containing ABC transporter [Nitrospirillum sp. BR 11828]|uniref:peptidase domain-containing ABC transporter n=1 Tax=Nitrospirillum sp. BR 11828 TaxID=3104325 RepID=UPI002ACA3CB4|nr:peptidase domain-containing ABC transporter [Nitrospirillum sp. BR 11828]MDZ5645844.1 peptidase domain-containing ABC transporter [Nitrospirillum sp. BR 11828]